MSWKLAVQGLLRPGSWWVANGKTAFSHIVTGNPRKNISPRGRIEALIEDASRVALTAVDGHRVDPVEAKLEQLRREGQQAGVIEGSEAAVTESEVAALVVDMAGRWPHQKAQLVGDDVVARYCDDLADLEAAHVKPAVESWYRDGHRFAPSGAQIIGHYAALVVDAPGVVAGQGGAHRPGVGARRRT